MLLAYHSPSIDKGIYLTTATRLGNARYLGSEELYERDLPVDKEDAAAMYTCYQPHSTH